MNPNVLLISEQMPYFKAIVYRSIPSRFHYLADDLAQDAIIKCIEKLDKYNPEKGNFKSWLYTVTQNLCFDALRKLDKMNEMPLTYDLVHMEDTTHLPDSEETKRIRQAICYLAPRDRRIIMYKFFFNCSGREISTILGIPENQVAMYYKRAKERLRTIYLAA